MDRELHYGVIEPLVMLAHRVRRNIYADLMHSDVSKLANSAAISIYHFREVRSGKGPMSSPAAEELRQKVADLADTAKHGSLDAARRTVHMTAGMVFEVDDREWFRFLGIEVDGRNARFGKFDIVETLLAFGQAVALECGWRIIVNRGELGPEFEPSVRTYLPKGAPPPVGMAIRIRRRDASGNLVPVNPKTIQLEVYEGSESLATQIHFGVEKT